MGLYRYFIQYFGVNGYSWKVVVGLFGGGGVVSEAVGRARARLVRRLEFTSSPVSTYFHSVIVVLLDYIIMEVEINNLWNSFYIPHSEERV